MKLIETTYYYTIEVSTIQNNDTIQYKWSIKDLKVRFKSSYGDSSMLPDKTLKKAKIELQEVVYNNGEIKLDEMLIIKLNSMRNKLSEYKTAAEDETLPKRKRKQNIETYEEYEIKESFYEKTYSGFKSIGSNLSTSTLYIK